MRIWRKLRAITTYKRHYQNKNFAAQTINV
jgi:hypothetical protein